MLLTFVNTICTNAPEGAGLVKRLIFMWWPANQQETLEVWCGMILAKRSARVFLSTLAD